MHGGLELLHRFDQLAFFLERLKAAMLLLQNGLFGIEHQTIERIHAALRSIRWQTVAERLVCSQ